MADGDIQEALVKRVARYFHSFLVALGQQWGVLAGLALILVTFVYLVNPPSSNSDASSETSQRPPAANHSTGADSNPLSLIVDSKDLDIGEVIVQDKYLRRFRISNHGDKDLEIASFRMSCSCTSITPSELRIPAHRSATAELTINLLHRDPKIAFQQARPVSTTITPILSDSSVQAPEWTFTGKAVSTVAVSVTNVIFPNAIQGIPCAPQTLTVRPYSKNGKLDIKCDPKFAATRLLDKQDWTVEVIPNPALDLGNHAGTIDIAFTPAEEESAAVISIPLDVFVVSDMQCEPKSLLLGNVAVGRAYSETLSVFSISKRKFSIDQVACDDPQVSMEIEQSDDPKVRVKFTLTPTMNGTGNGKLSIHGANSDGTNPFVVTVPYFYRLTN